ncbi:Wzz/FepE/Etk N-terminal domain-containing protein [Rhodohalobacter sp. 8-1]|uniref:Wzz/FepE/Etk N-terminal domain-containing protein n=1 Tax=Rhodohalobacter sp. 8-1 TaxID=3131972 RepID=UPI0030ED008F
MSDEKESSGQPRPEKRKSKKDGDEFPLQEYRLVPVEEWDGSGDNGENEIDLVELAKHIWENRSTIYKFLAVGIVFGLAVALLSPKEYQSGATLMPEMPSESGASSLLQQYGGLLGMSGSADLGSEGMIPPQLYPQIVQSLPFQLELLNQEVRFNEFDTTATVYTFFDEINTPSIFSYITGYTIGLPGKIIGLFREETPEMGLPRGFEADSIISVTKDQMEIIDNMRGRVNVSLNEQTGVINLTVEMPDPNAAAQVAKTSIELIKEYVTQYRTRKAQEDLQFSQEQLESAEERFREAQDRLAEFRDANINLSTARAQTQQQRLQSEYDLTFNVYNSMAQQVEQAKLKVQEQTPVVSILQPVQVPVDDTTSGLRVLILFVVLAGVCSIVLILFKYYIRK